MKKTYNKYLLDRKYKIYFTFGESFIEKKSALKFAESELSRLGKLVEVMCLAVPDCACQKCGEMLFDWQSMVGECCGTSASDTCYYSLADGLICNKCANHEIELEVHEVLMHGTEVAAQDTMCYLIQ